MKWGLIFVLAAGLLVLGGGGMAFAMSSVSIVDLQARAQAALLAYPPGIVDCCAAMALNEGFGVPGAVPTRANNPLDYKQPGWTGAVTGAENIPVAPDEATGWKWGAAELQYIANGRSAVYGDPSQLTIAAFLAKWTNNNASAASNVIAALQQLGHGVTADTAIGDLFSGSV